MIDLLSLGLTLGVFWAMRKSLPRLAALEAMAYTKSSWAKDFAKHQCRGFNLLFWISLLILGGWAQERALASWSELHQGNIFRSFALVSLGIPTWVVFSHEYNSFLDRAHHRERILSLLVLLLAAWKPFFLIPCIVWLWAAVRSFGFPFSAGIKMPYMPFVTGITLLIKSHFLVFCLTQEFDARTLWFLTLCLLAAQYAFPGFTKMSHRWTQLNRLHLMPLSWHLRTGWLYGFGIDKVTALTRKMAKFNYPLMVWVVLVESAGVFFLLDSRFTGSLLFLWLLFHLGVVAVSGLFVWPWMLIDATALYWWWSGAFPRFSAYEGLLSVLLIALSGRWARALPITWFESNVNYIYEFAMEDIEGRTHTFTADSFAPFKRILSFKVEEVLGQNRLPLRAGCNGELTALAYSINSAPELFRLEESHGRPAASQQAKDDFEGFLRQFLCHRCRWQRPAVWYDTLAPPGLALGRKPQARFPSAPIWSVEVWESTYLYANSECQLVRTLCRYKIQLER